MTDMTRNTCALTPSDTLKPGDIVFPRWFIQGTPVGASTDTALVVREIVKRDKRARCERDDGRQGSWWVDFGHVRKQGEE